MNLKEKANLIIYRFREKGLEVFLVNPSDEEGQWEFPNNNALGNEKVQGEADSSDRFIELDPVVQESGTEEKAIAVEGDWHDIPSLKGMLYEDAMILKDKIAEMEKGTYFALKEAFKKVMPHQYAFLKELKDILMDRNSTRDL